MSSFTQDLKLALRRLLKSPRFALLAVLTLAFAIGATAPGALTYIRSTHMFSALDAYRFANYELSGTTEPAQINATRLTASLFPILGVSTSISRVFSEQEESTGTAAAVLSFETWRTRFNADSLDRKPYQIIGVMPRDFEFPVTEPSEPSPPILGRSHI